MHMQCIWRVVVVSWLDWIGCYLMGPAGGGWMRRLWLSNGVIDHVHPRFMNWRCCSLILILSVAAKVLLLLLLLHATLRFISQARTTTKRNMSKKYKSAFSLSHKYGKHISQPSTFRSCEWRQFQIRYHHPLHTIKCLFLKMDDLHLGDSLWT